MSFISRSIPRPFNYSSRVPFTPVVVEWKVWEERSLYYSEGPQGERGSSSLVSTRPSSLSIHFPVLVPCCPRAGATYLFSKCSVEIVGTISNSNSKAEDNGNDKNASLQSGFFEAWVAFYRSGRTLRSDYPPAFFLAS